MELTYRTADGVEAKVGDIVFIKSYCSKEKIETVKKYDRKYVFVDMSDSCRADESPLFAIYQPVQIYEIRKTVTNNIEACYAWILPNEHEYTTQSSFNPNKKYLFYICPVISSSDMDMITKDFSRRMIVEQLESQRIRLILADLAELGHNSISDYLSDVEFTFDFSNPLNLKDVSLKIKDKLVYKHEGNVWRVAEYHRGEWSKILLSKSKEILDLGDKKRKEDLVKEIESRAIRFAELEG